LDTFKRLRGPAIISVLLTVVPLLSSSAIVYFLIKNESTLGNLHWAEWVFVTLAFACTSMTALSPPTLLAMVYGYFLGALAIPYLFSLNMGAITAVYFLTKRGFGNSLESFIDGNPKSKRLLDELKNDELKVIFLAKLSPVLPFALTNFVFALSGATFRNVFLGGFLGMIPRTLLAVWIGSNGVNIKILLENPETADWQQVIVLLLVVISTWGLIRIVRKVIA
jgi:uncharacterized membrane protein YdjX (TVP38/TMEM64 family)